MFHDGEKIPMARISRIFAFTALGLAALPLTSTTALGASDVGVSISVGEPGFYGRLDIGDYPAPRVVYRQPVVVGYVDAGRDPVYLRVPPGHRRHWSRHCSEYNACGERVYFVRDDWYNDVYAPQYRERHDNRNGGRHHDGHRDHDGRRDHNDRRNDGDRHDDAGRRGDNGDRGGRPE